MRSLPFVAVVALVVACGDRTPLEVTTLDGGAYTSSSGCSVEGVTGSVPGVSISIRSDKCVYRVGEPAKFTYEVTTDSRLPPIVIAASQSCGSCRSAADDPLAFTSYDIDGIANGMRQLYCLCDVGCCAPDRAQTITITPATKTGVIEWSGRNWQGPSDTGNQEGAFFPPGSYGVHVSFSGGELIATLPIEIVP
jgi:hypothetical protein